VEVFELTKDKQEFKVKQVATLNCHYTLTNAFFSPWEPHIIFASSKSGDIFKWDLKKEEKFPVVKSVVARNGHDYPVHGTDIVGTGKIDSTIISVSNDGCLCMWKTNENFHQPHNNANYRLKGDMGDLEPHSISFPETKQTTFFLACQDSKIYRGELPKGAQN